MFILGDEAHDRGKLPWVTFTLLGLNLLVGAAQMRFGDKMTNGLALVPKEVTEFRDLKGRHPLVLNMPRIIGVDEDGDLIVGHQGHTVYIQHHAGPFPIVLTVFTYMFLHADFFHFIFNMWFLWIFARNVECALDHGRFICFYLACGVLAGLSQVFADTRSIVPIVGASGAIAGVMGAYLAIFPNNPIKVVFGGIGLMFGVVRVPAFMVIGLWFVGQYLAGAMTMHDDMVGGTAYWCHIGGFLAGFISIKGTVLYLHHEIAKLKAEQEEEQGEETPLPDYALPAPEIPTVAEIDATMDPVAAFKRARMGVFRDTAENDPFHRPTLEAELVEDLPAELMHGVTSEPPRPRPRSGGDPVHPFGELPADAITVIPSRRSIP